VAEYRVIDRKDRATRIAEYDTDAFVGYDLHDNVRASQALAGERMVRRCRLQLRIHVPVSSHKPLSRWERGWGEGPAPARRVIRDRTLIRPFRAPSPE